MDLDIGSSFTTQTSVTGTDIILILIIFNIDATHCYNFVTQLRCSQGPFYSAGSNFICPYYAQLNGGFLLSLLHLDLIFVLESGSSDSVLFFCCVDVISDKAPKDEVRGSSCFTPGVGVRTWLKFLEQMLE